MTLNDGIYADLLDCGLSTIGLLAGRKSHGGEIGMLTMIAEELMALLQRSGSVL